MSYSYDYPHPAVTVDVIVFTIHDNDLKVLLIQRAGEPFAGMWALPGGFVGMRESLRRAAWRELREETGVSAAFLRQLGAFGHPDRDPRERVITVAYYALLPFDRLQIQAASDARDARLFSVGDLPELAFDHPKILRRARDRLRSEIDDPVIALQLVPERFTLPELQRACELILDTPLDKRNFRKRIQGLGVIEATGEQRRTGPNRPARLYRASHASILTVGTSAH